MLQEQGYSDIETYIQSGNVVLSGAVIDKGKISSVIESKFGFTPKVLVLSKKEFLEAIKKNPYASDQGKTIHFYFCEGKPQVDQEKLEVYKSATEQFTLKGKVFYLYAPEGIGRSKLAANVESCLAVPVTARNLNTVNKLQEMLA